MATMEQWLELCFETGGKCQPKQYSGINCISLIWAFQVAEQGTNLL